MWQNEPSPGLAQPPLCVWHDTDCCHDFSRVSRVVSSPHISASGKNHTMLCVIHPNWDAPGKPAGCTALAVAEDSPFHAVSSTHFLTAASCPHLPWSQAMVEMPSCSGITLYICSHAAGSSRSSSPCALCRQEQGGGMAGMPSGGHASSRELSCTQTQRGPTAHSKTPPRALLLWPPWDHQGFTLYKPNPAVDWVATKCSSASRPRIILQGVYFLLKVLSEAISPCSTSDYLLSGCKCFPQCSKLSQFSLTAL